MPTSGRGEGVVGSVPTLAWLLRRLGVVAVAMLGGSQATEGGATMRSGSGGNKINAERTVGLG